MSLRDSIIYLLPVWHNFDVSPYGRFATRGLKICSGSFTVFAAVHKRYLTHKHGFNMILVTFKLMFASMEKSSMMTSSNGSIFRVSGPLCGEFTGHPHKGQWRGALMFSLICAWIKGWVNNHKAGDLRRHRAHYDVAVIRSRPTAYLSTSLKLRTYLNLRKCVLKFKYANFALWPTTKT